MQKLTHEYSQQPLPKSSFLHAAPKFAVGCEGGGAQHTEVLARLEASVLIASSPDASEALGEVAEGGPSLFPSSPCHHGELLSPARLCADYFLMNQSLKPQSVLHNRHRYTISVLQKTESYEV